MKMSLLQRIFNKRNNKSDGKPAFEFILPYVLVLLLGFMIADLGTLYLRPYMLPKEAPPKKPQKKIFKTPSSKSVYSPIASRNIFNSEGKIPDTLASLAKKETGEEENSEDDGPATLSRLPIKLLGTIVHRNPSKSIATVQLTSQNKTSSYKPEEEMDGGVAKVLEVQRRKVIIRNLNNNKKEFIEIPEDLKINFGSKTAAPAKVDSGNDLVQVRGNTRVIKRADFLNQTKKMGEILRQASMAPNKGPDGSIQGFKFLSIKPGSVFEKLGFKNGDVIKGVNGEPVNSAAKAMELYNVLKSDASSVNIDINSGGKDNSVNYVIE